MKLTLVNGFENERSLQVAFDIVTKELGIDGLKNEVLLKFFSSEPKIMNPIEALFGGGVLELKQEMGATHRDMGPNGEVLMKLNEYRDNDPCQCEICRKSKPAPTVLETFCHEMAHVAQIVSGRLVKAKNGKAQWEGKVLNRVPAYADMPWEHEADAFEKRVSKKVKEVLCAKGLSLL